MTKLATKTSVIVMLGALHYMINPQAMLAALLRTGRPLVMIDTTRELMIKRIAEDRRLCHPLCDEHLLCIDAATTVGFCTKKDITELLTENCARWPQLFEYGDFAWMAAWDGV